MAQFGTEATQMSSPDTGAAKFIRKPTQDTSGVDLLSSALGQIPEALTGYNLSALDVDIKDIAEEYKLRGGEAEQVLAEKSAQRLAVDNIWNTFDEVDINKVNQIETSINKDLKKYQMAYEQGTMSSDELIGRVNAATRAAIARQPGLARELISQAELYQNLAGVSDMITTQQKMEKAIAADRDKAIEDENKMLIKWGDNPNTIPSDQRPAIVAEAFRQEKDSKLMESFLQGAQILKTRGELTEKLVDQAVLSPQSVAARTAFNQMISNTVSNKLMSGKYRLANKDRTRSATEAELLGITEEFATYRGQLQSVAMLGSDKSRPVLEGQIKQLDELEKLHKDIVMGGSTAQAAQYQLQARQAAAKLPFVTLEQQLQIAQQYSSALSNLSNAGLQVIDPKAVQPMIQHITEAIQNYNGGVGGTPINQINFGTKEGKIQAAYLFSSIDPENHPIMSPEEVIVHNDKNMLNNLRQFKDVVDPIKFNQAFDSWLSTVVDESSRTGKPISERYSPTTVQEVNKFLGDAMNNARSSGKLSYSKSSNSFIVMNSDGTPNNAQTKRVNTMFRGYLSFNGYKADTKIDEAGDVISALANLKPAETTLKEKSVGPVKQGQLTEEQLKNIGITSTQLVQEGEQTNKTSLEGAMQITPEMQAERDKTRTRVLQMELDEYKQKLSSSKDEPQKKLYEDNIRYVIEELRQLGVQTK